jgi:hypothetical protein
VPYVQFPWPSHVTPLAPHATPPVVGEYVHEPFENVPDGM